MPIMQTMKYEAERDREFAQWVISQTGGENLRHCIQCGTCSSTCPLSLYMDYTPRRIINLAREGFKKEVLSSFTIWLCSSCYSCRVECPKQIQVTDVMYMLKRRAIQEGVYPSRFPIPVLDKTFSWMVYTFGRVNESLLASLLFFFTNWFKFLSMTGLGLNLMRTGRMSFLPEQIKRKDELRKILDSIDAQKNAEVTK
jgi:heterodisulfide reductase subunit C